MVIEELKFIGETWMINEPSLARRYRQWLKKNAEAIAMSMMERVDSENAVFSYKGILHSIN
jgi:hypothetical protein